jgi:hypothetical protein
MQEVTQTGLLLQRISPDALLHLRQALVWLTVVRLGLLLLIPSFATIQTVHTSKLTMPVILNIL